MTAATKQAVFEPSRAAGLARLSQFVPRAGRAYGNTRNSDLGPGERSNVSCLSPYLRHRLITEDEVVRAVLATHSLQAAEKFVQEVCWRTYWKGWLEQRPSVWHEYLSELNREQARVAANSGLSRALSQAASGASGIECFDAWVRELTDTGYLHNHARMWFASVWIFTLKLPWTLGADFFYRHLLDGDAASNTLSWRWVAGLQTRGKHYVARADNIARYTGGRFDPTGDLNEDAEALDGPELPAASKLRMLPPVPSGGDVVLLLTEDDLSPEVWHLAGHRVAGVAALPADASYPGLSARVVAFKQAALDEALARAGHHFACPTLALGITPHDALAAFCKQCIGAHIITAEVPVGPARKCVSELQQTLARSGSTLFEVRSQWDGALWPHARKGFFQLKEKIPGVLEQLEVL
jgi:deoxyribodipyrimidine photo-lyase